MTTNEALAYLCQPVYFPSGTLVPYAEAVKKITKKPVATVGKLFDPKLVRRIVEEVHPLRVILFGSAARGEVLPGGDVDLLVVMPDGTHRRRTAQYLYSRLLDVEVGFDVLVATPVVLEKHKDNIGLIYRTILREGREVYAVPGPVDQPGSLGPHLLIQDGAKLVTGVEDIFEEIPQLRQAARAAEE